MTLLDVQRRFRELGRIRMGATAISQKGKPYPVKLSEWRLTSASEAILHVAADVYGGDVRPWTGAPTGDGTQFELLTGTNRLDVLLPPGEPLSQYWELWSGGGCVRRCNGLEQTNGDPCACPSDLDERLAQSKLLQPTACKATTRLSIILPRLPDIGVWRLESHGMNAAVELPGTVEILRAALDQGQMIPAQLRIEPRTSKKNGETHHFIVPVLELPTVTTAQLMSGDGYAEIEAPRAATRALEAGRGGEGRTGSPSRALPAPPTASSPRTPEPSRRESPPLPGEQSAAAGRGVDDTSELVGLFNQLPNEKKSLLQKDWRKADLPLSPDRMDDDQLAAALLFARQWVALTLFESVGLTEKDRHAAMLEITGGATDSTKELSFDELRAVTAWVQARAAKNEEPFT